MSCSLIEKISSLIDGELPPAEARALERHASECAECQQARADFLSMRSQIAAYSLASDPVAHRALTAILAKDRQPPVGPTLRARRSLGLFDALRFNPLFATIMLLVVAGVVGLLLHRNSMGPGQSTKPADDLSASQKRSIKSPSPTAPSNSGSSPVTTDSKGEGTTRPADARRRKQKTRPPIEIPKPRTPPDDLVSPWRSQAIAVNNTPDEWAFDLANVADTRAADAETLTARHLEQSELLLRSFRNVRTVAVGARSEVSYERQRAQRLVYQNIMLRREADAAGDVQVATLLGSLEPILLDIANLPENAHDDDVRAIKERLQRQNLVALLQVNSTVLARANE
jgi:Putative zinc-finger